MRILRAPFIAPLYEKATLTIEFDKKDLREVEALMKEVGEGEYTLSIKKKSKRRSLDANAYAWVLIGKLAKYYKMSPEEVYLRTIEHMHTYEILPIKAEAVDRWEEIWRAKGTGWITRRLGSSKLKGYENVICYYGSSTYETAEMSRFIDLIIEECHAADIVTDMNTERLLKEWEKDTSNSSAR